MRKALGVAWFFAVSTAVGQITGGALVGRVSDEHDRPLPGVEVSATHVATGLTRTLRSAADGRYRFPTMPTGSYEVKATLPQYTTVSVRKIDVLLGVARHVDIRLRRVTEEEELTVTAPVHAVESGPAIGIIIGRDLLSDVPLRQRTAKELATIAPFANPRVALPFRETLIDGAISVSDPPLDAVEQINGTTRQYPAEFGRTSGGVVLIETRKGSDAIAGDAFALYRRVEQHWQIGAAASGPVAKDLAHAFVAAERDSGENDRLFAAVNADLAARHFVEATYGSDRDNGTLRDSWLVDRSLWNELILRAASGANEARDSLSGSVDFPAMRHDWTVGAMATKNAQTGYFAQDQITFRKLVLSAGVRYDRHDAISGYSPRFGCVYDINGSGRNLLRASVGRYLDPDTTAASIGYSWQMNPWVALNIDGLRGTQRGERAYGAIAVSGAVAFSTLVALTGSYTYSDRAIAADASRHSFSVAGTMHFPGGFWLSGIGRYRSASQLANRLVGTDLRAAKTFEMRRLAFDVLADVFNAFNQDRRAFNNERVGQFGLRLRF